MDKEKKKMSPIIKYGGGLLLVIVILGAIFQDKPKKEAQFPTTPAPATQKQWFTGGTLHNATTSEWLSATRDNKLATVSDWLVSTKWKKYVETTGDFDKLKTVANAVVDGLDQTVTADTTGSLKVNGMFAALVTLTRDYDPK